MTLNAAGPAFNHHSRRAIAPSARRIEPESPGRNFAERCSAWIICVDNFRVAKNPKEGQPSKVEQLV
jgi:hypothetical protein